MSFDNRQSTRVNVAVQFYFWLGEATEGPGRWGHSINLSESGLAFHCAQGLEPGTLIHLELSLPGRGQALRLWAQAVNSKLEPGAEGHHQVRVHFVRLELEQSQALRQFVLQVAEPAMGWGKTYFPGRQAIEVKYRLLEQAEQKLWMEKRAYLSFKEVGYLKHYQEHLEGSLGAKNPEGFRMLGTKPLKLGAEVWLEFELPQGRLHFLAKVLWSNPEEDGRSESGLGLVAFHKEEAIKLEKQP